MTANLIFDNVHAYGVGRFDVLLGQTFTIALEGQPEGVEWFSNNDQVLSIAVAGNGGEAVVSATAKGSCKIQLQVNGTTHLTLQCEVFDVIAASLNPTAGQPVLK